MCFLLFDTCIPHFQIYLSFFPISESDTRIRGESLSVLIRILCAPYVSYRLSSRGSVNKTQRRASRDKKSKRILASKNKSKTNAFFVHRRCVAVHETVPGRVCMRRLTHSLCVTLFLFLCLSVCVCVSSSLRVSE